jgi:hypothetical protein
MRNYLTKLLFDLLLDRGSDKFSITKFLAMSSFFMYIAYLVFGLYIMHDKHEFDHVLFGELSFFILTLLGFKTFKKDPNANSNIDSLNESKSTKKSSPTKKDDDDDSVF